ncbi:hypothetical protein [Nocardia mexicana]|nr:hypothetical protein [Nocardia mexicana]
MRILTIECGQLSVTAIGGLVTRYRLGVVSRDHVRRGVELGIAQANA